MRRDTLRNGVILAYMLGNALTFNALLKAERTAFGPGEDWTPHLPSMIARALVWPLYWLVRLINL